MDLTERYRADKQLVEKGVDVVIDGTTFTISYSDSSRSKLLLHNKAQEYVAKGSDADEAVILALHDVLVDRIVLGWKNLKLDGKSVPYSKDKLRELLDTFVGFDMDLMDEASNIEHFVTKNKDEQEKNL